MNSLQITDNGKDKISKKKKRNFWVGEIVSGRGELRAMEKVRGE